ncbi:hypothetical protein [Pseudomonas chlororaphis]|uniref:hypothetical protein n=1 Tax=Pseudomonas chlororaphis TaxID=587753 RepID=UPI0007B3D832|nr:hypothetical protein [Pseudomonas chlororaphis]MBP5055378.1 hypothetical protein [Pseudomonas chlororaphis]MBP5066929.1 hypothetical protein [Pseudomonas chlororaphis]MBP5087413.1 hypothetical protein [Pseudomonas chlororaphis]MBP5138876.1 hypothetical protein [Pseudomonas chlororaphis]QTT81630.1 hypothetical protein HUT29_10060 [Pseudomonas chlororaphis]
MEDTCTRWIGRSKRVCCGAALLLGQGSGSAYAGVGRVRILRRKAADGSVRGRQGPLRHQVRAGFGRNSGVQAWGEKVKANSTLRRRRLIAQSDCDIAKVCDGLIERKL